MDQYIVSARKYRPTTFESVVGQKALTETLRNAIRSGHLAHAYLFCGPRGVGKTTCARIFAKTINCLNPTGNHDACNQCESCVAFNEQRSFNIHELDAASNNSVDDIRSLIDQVRIPPQIGRYSVYIIDEVHMLSAGAFNALLKTLEEPPSYAIFILATTEKHKVLPTILSRCQVYDFSRITAADTIAHLQYVAQQEGVTASEEALNVIAQKADGGMRDALSIFDQLVSFAGNDITYERAIEVLNVLDSDYYFRLVDLAIAHNVQGMLLLLDEVLQKGFDAQHFVTGLGQHLRDVLVSKDPQTVQLLETSNAIRKRYAEQAQHCPAVWLFQALDRVNTCDIQYRTARNKRLTVELCLIKLATPQEPVPQPVAKPAPAAQQPASQPVSAQPTQPRHSAPAAPNPVPAAPMSQPAPAMPNLPKVGGLPSMPSLGKPITSVAPPQPDTSAEQQKRNNPFTLDQLEGAWAGLSVLFQEEQRQAAMLSAARPRLDSPNHVVITLANVWQKEELKKIGKRVMDHIRDTLQNDNLTLSVEVADHKHVQVAYTDEEKFRVLAAKNPELLYAKEKLNLQLD